MKIAKKIRELRIERKMTLKETAKHLEVPVSTYRDWEYGRKIPADAAIKLAEIFDVPMSIFSGRGVSRDADLERAVALMEEALKIVRSAV